MLVNISNHPASKWSKEQHDIAAMLFGEVYDLPSPEIPPEWNGFEVCECIDDFINEHWNLFNPLNSILLAGELSFCIALYHRLQTYNIRCYVTTSQRNTFIRFRFVQFR